jgi:hypothetical protein
MSETGLTPFELCGTCGLAPSLFGHRIKAIA